MQKFLDDDAGYLQWVGNNPEGFVVNCERQPKSNYLKLHSAKCFTINGTPTNGRYWTRDYIKVCSLNRQELETWARQQVGGELNPCGTCKP